jgi:hypothetical protein
MGQGRLPRQRDVGVPPGYIFLSCPNPQLQILVLLGPDPFVPTGGFGGWDIVDRSRQVAMTIPKGIEPYQYTGSIMFDGLKHRQSQQDDINRLMRCAHGDDASDPGIVSISGLPDLPADDWIIENLDFDADSQIRHNKSMELIRQKVTLTIREYIHPDYIKSAPSALKRPKTDTTIITTKEGDTSHKIAVRQNCEWTDIKRLNPTRKIHKANQKLPKGWRLRVPRKESKKHKDKKSKTRSHRRG